MSAASRRYTLPVESDGRISILILGGTAEGPGVGSSLALPPLDYGGNSLTALTAVTICIVPMFENLQNGTVVVLRS